MFISLYFALSVDTILMGGTNVNFVVGDKIQRLMTWARVFIKDLRNAS